MSREAIERFAKAVREDQGMQEELKTAATSNEALVEFAKSKGYDVNLDEIIAYINERKATLSEEDLDKVAGGKQHAHVSKQVEVSAVEAVGSVTTVVEAEAAVTTSTAVAQAEVVIIAT